MVVLETMGEKSTECRRNFEIIVKIIDGVKYRIWKY
jgi:hypothetical protein